MSEFVEIMNRWTRICKANECEDCPLLDAPCVVDLAGYDHYEELEALIMKNNPEDEDDKKDKCVLSDDTRSLIHDLVDKVLQCKGALITIGLYENGPYISISTTSDESEADGTQDAVEKGDAEAHDELREN